VSKRVQRSHELDHCIQEASDSQLSSVVELAFLKGVASRLVLGILPTADLLGLLSSDRVRGASWKSRLDKDRKLPLALEAAESLAKTLGHELLQTIHLIDVVQDLSPRTMTSFFEATIAEGLEKGLLHRSKSTEVFDVLIDSTDGQAEQLEVKLGRVATSSIRNFLRSRWYPYEPKEYDRAKEQLQGSTRVDQDSWGRYLHFFTLANTATR
jgi:hypothetical protein